ncbi:MAG TPA: hypothetical protein VK911_10880 [Vicinamibacterales bacterium]|nr:hypothetical protein [Vicinamibacterales bacterium]
MNAAYLAHLAGAAGVEAAASLRDWSAAGRPEGVLARLYLRALAVMEHEVRQRLEEPAFRSHLLALAAGVGGPSPAGSPDDFVERCWKVFFPEGGGIRGREDRAMTALRDRRRVAKTTLNRRPIRRPALEMLFTANVLLTVPLDEAHRARVPARLRPAVDAASAERQAFWYDHPIPVGVPAEANEVLYGLRGLDEAVQFEKRRGTVGPDEVATVLLSVSVTHDGLHAIASDYLAGEISRVAPFAHVRLLFFTEAEAGRLARDVLEPAARLLLGRDEPGALEAVFGVDGEYGRHYTFLKAIAPLYALLVDPRVRATFKIDLDQVFPQAHLVRETGRSAFENFTTPLWGALGRDADDQPVELGMIAGALVNDRDIERSLFTPDVDFPGRQPAGDELIFWSSVPQALSTRAEMMFRGAESHAENCCLQRVHVTGGTNGILIDSLRRHRPFTPAFIGRAEDQAYFLSVLHAGEPALRYLHAPGLIMRHDKYSFAAGAVRAAGTGKLVGDYARQLLFSGYARALPWPVERIKAQVDPFTGCFISPMPATVVGLRLALRAARLAAERNEDEAATLLAIGAERLLPLLAPGWQDGLEETYRRERASWHLYFDVLDALESALSRGDQAAAAIADRGRSIFAEALQPPE